MKNTTMSTGKLQEVKPGSREAAILQQRQRQKQGLVARIPSGLIQPLPKWFWGVTVGLALLGYSTKYPLLSVSSALLLPIMASLLWFKGESPILLACCVMQWLQIVTPVFYCDVYRVTFQEAFEFPEMAMATQLSLWGILVLTVGIRIALGRWSTAPAAMYQEARAISMPRLARLWWITFFITSVFAKFAWRGGSLMQVLVAVGSIKWVVFYVLTFKVLNGHEGSRTLIAALLIEFAKGLLGFFGSFKEVLLMFLIGVMTSSKSMTFKLRCMSVIVIAAGLMASVFWSAIKIEYRNYLQDAWAKQGGDIPITEKVAALRKISARTEGGIMHVGIDRLLARLSYTQWFGATLAHVPSLVPHEGGTLWLDAVKHVMMPRLLFPNKAILDDSARTAKFTGVDVAGTESGTSIGIGYMAESYVDFGAYGMMVPIFILGLLMGGVYRYFTVHNSSRLWGTALGTAALFSLLFAYATEGVKILGGFVSVSLFLWALNMALGAKIKRWLTEQAVTGRR